jgi:hypothetical protein
VTRVPRWRIATAAGVLAVLALFAAVVAPIYYRDMQLQSFVRDLPRRVDDVIQAGSPPSDDLVRTWVLHEASRLGIPVKPDDVQVLRSAGSRQVERIEVRYFVQVDLPGYTVNLHFYPGAGSR